MKFTHVYISMARGSRSVTLFCHLNSLKTSNLFELLLEHARSFSRNQNDPVCLKTLTTL